MTRDKAGTWRADWPSHEGDDLGPPSVAWTTWHILFWWSKALAHLRGEARLSHEDVPWPGDADAVRARLTQLHDRWLARLAACGDADLARVCDTSWPLSHATLAATAGWLNPELMKNAAELGTVRFLHATRQPGNSS